MKKPKYSFQELKLTAILYSTRQGVLEHVRKTGLLPDDIPMGGFPIAVNRIIQKRGTDPDLSKDEILVLKAIFKTGKLTGGAVLLVNRDEEDEEGEE